MRDMLPPALSDSVEKAGLKTIASVLCGTLALAEATEDGALLSRSEVDAPDQISGVLNVYLDSFDTIPAGDLEQLKAFAEQAAVAIQNVRRWDRVKEQLQATSSMNTSASRKASPWSTAWFRTFWMLAGDLVRS